MCSLISYTHCNLYKSHLVPQIILFSSKTFTIKYSIISLFSLKMGNNIQTFHLSKEVLDYWGYKTMLSTVDDTRREIYLPSKNIVSIEQGVFFGFNQLTSLDLSNNSLTEIQSYTFKGLNLFARNQLNI